jgi:hypothetical protein
VAAPTSGLVRVVGRAGCDGVFDAGPAVIELTTARPRHRWKFDVPASGGYQLWLEPGAVATFALSCPPPHCSNPACGSMVIADEPMTVNLPSSPSGRFEAPSMQMTSGCTCD